MRTQVFTGLASWFTLPTQPGVPPPPRYKMAVLTWATIFPLITLVVVATAPLLVLNLNLLLWTALIPFPTAVVAEHLGGVGEAARTASALYCGVLLLIMLFSLGPVCLGHPRCPPAAPATATGVVRGARMRFTVGLGVYPVALALSWVSAPLALCGLMALYYAFDQASVPAAVEPSDQQPTGRST